MFSGRRLLAVAGGDFRGLCRPLPRLGHTSAARAGASAYFGDDGQLRRVSEALPAGRSSQHLLGSEPFDERHGSSRNRDRSLPGAGSLSFRLRGILLWRSGREKLPADRQQVPAATPGWRESR